MLNIQLTQSEVMHLTDILLYIGTFRVEVVVIRPLGPADPTDNWSGT